MEGYKDELLEYFTQEYDSTCQKYSRKIPIEEFRAQTHKQIKTHFQFLNESNTIKQKNNFMPTILEIRGDRMRSVVDDGFYAIFCQAPSKWNSGHFWSTCYQQKVKKIFMLCTNSYDYWPSKNKQLKFEQQGITVRCFWEEPIGQVLIRRPIIITGPQGQHSLEHLHFIKWRDGGIPQGQESEKAFRILVEEAINHIQNNEMITIHCLAGIGRTGTLGAVIEGVRCLRKFKALSLFEIVRKMRQDRDYCVQRFQQYCFAHRQVQLIP